MIRRSVLALLLASAVVAQKSNSTIYNGGDFAHAALHAF